MLDDDEWLRRRYRQASRIGRAASTRVTFDISSSKRLGDTDEVAVAPFQGTVSRPGRGTPLLARPLLSMMIEIGRDFNSRPEILYPRARLLFIVTSPRQ